MIRLYRSLILEDEPDLRGNVVPPKTGFRIPKNIPLYIDNIWEWTRPESHPSRRFAVFASPSVQLAEANGPRAGIVYEIKPLGNIKLCQLQGLENARMHPDCDRLHRILLNVLGDGWLDQPIGANSCTGKLRNICLPGPEIERLMEQDLDLRAKKEAIRDAVELWQSALLVNDMKRFKGDDIGEMFFESSQGFALKNFFQ